LRASLSIEAILPSGDPPPGRGTAQRQGLHAIPRSRIFLLGAVALALLAWGVERLIVTDGEAIERLLANAASAVERGDFDAVASALSDDFRNQQDRQDARQFVTLVRSAWTSFGNPAPRIHVLDSTIQGDTAALRVRVVASGFPPLQARIECVRSPDGWRIQRLVEYQVGSYVR
jgi:hypothetical protein